MDPSQESRRRSPQCPTRSTSTSRASSGRTPRRGK
ncbi:hypothetical protein Esi_0074_0070 [Ectocarpus siliculosus]|uniref:Uncharacterized protein n=1 Tax=Ectocarpus siliculosus TaxID=2880 RepID=D8LSL2_ECTSI|nr:hypothetical protein Esi_0074_0070 [Ectocarpus siliculosus]|eukprot:CBN77849.1 hypothetical protein Esi_0074_0070 [Ectocarpus siliculosus]